MNPKNVGQFLFSLIALAGTLFCVWFGSYAVTNWGKMVAIWGLILSNLPLVTYLRFSQHRQQRLWLLGNWAMIGAVGGGIVAAWLLAPSGMSRPGSPISQHFTSQRPFPRYSPTNIIPETEQINLGFLVTPLLDPLFTYDRAKRVAPFTLQLYQEMEADPNFHQLGSAMGWAYTDLFGLPFNVGHYYLYIPQHRGNGPLPAVIFLHGSFGNFKSYTWVWSKLAEQLGYVIIAPSFGFGNWQRPEGVVTVQEVLADAQHYVQLDTANLYLAGLSNGGLGVSLLANDSPNQFRGLIFISPVMASVVNDSQFQQVWATRPVLVITGEADERIPIAYVNERVARLQAGGVAVSYLTYPGQDHFLFFAQADDISQKIGQWLTTAQP